MVPCLVREDMVMAEVDGQTRTYCHEACRWTDVEAFRPTYQGRETPNMGQLIGKREGRRCITAGTGPTWSPTWVTSATTDTPWWPSRI